MNGEQQLLQQLVSHDVLERACAWLEENDTLSLSEKQHIQESVKSKLLSGEYCFYPVRAESDESGEHYRWQQEDLVVLHAMAMVLGSFCDVAFNHSSALESAASAVARCSTHLRCQPNGWLLQGDLTNSLLQIEHQLLYNKLNECFAGETLLLRLLWQYLNISIDRDGAYTDLNQGLLPGNPLYPVLCELYLQELDNSLSQESVAFVRFQGEWMLVSPTRWRLESVQRVMSETLERLGLQQSCHTGMRRAGQGGCFLGCSIASGRTISPRRQKKSLEDELRRRCQGWHGDSYFEQNSTRWCGSERYRSQLTSLPQDKVTSGNEQPLRYTSTLPNTLWAIPLMGGAGLAHAGVAVSNIGVTVGPNSSVISVTLHANATRSDFTCYGTNVVNQAVPAGAATCYGHIAGAQWDPNPVADSNQSFGGTAGLVAADSYITFNIPDGQTRWYRVKTGNAVRYGWLEVRRDGNDYIFVDFVYEDTGVINGSLTPSGAAADTTAPRVASIVRQTPAASPTNADTLVWRVTFDEDVQNVDAGDFTRSGTTATLSVNAVSATVYDVTLSGGDLADLDGTVTLGFAGGQNIEDTSGNALSNTTPTGTNNNSFVLDNAEPTVSSVDVPADGTYVAGDNLNFTVNTNENVDVSGTPRLTLTIGSTTKYATYVSGGGGTALLFRYTVESGLTDSDGIALGGSIDLNGGTLQDAVDNDLNTTLNSVGSLTNVLVDSVAPTVSSVNVPANGTYAAGSNLDFTVNTNENVDVSGTPQLTLTIGSATKYATYVSGSGGTALLFRYTVESGLTDSDGIALGGSIDPNGGTMHDGADNDLNTTLNSVGSTANVNVDSTAPGITSFARQTPATSPTNADSLTWLVTFSEDVQNVDATDFSVNGGTTATVTGVVQSTASTYQVTVSGGDLASYNGTVGLDLDGGHNITDLSGNSLPTSEPATDETYVLDNIAPTVSSVNVPANGTYAAGSNLDFTVNTNENVDVSGTPQLTLTIGSTTKYAVYVSGGGGTALLFRYTVESGLTDSDGIALGGSIDPNGGTMHDGADNDLNTTLNSVGSTANVNVDSTAPGITSFARQTPATSPTNADSLTWLVTFSEDVQNVDATDFSVNGGTSATVTGVVQQTASTYQVTVSGGDLASYNGTVGLDLNVGHNITDLSGNLLPDGEPATDETYVLDNTNPTVSSVNVPVNGTYAAGSNLDFTVNTNENVDVSGTPRLTLTIGSTTKYATYVSGSGGTALLFRYTVESGLTDSDGIALGGSIDPNGGTMQDGADNDLNTTLNSVGSTANVNVDSTAPGITSFARQTPATSPTNADSLTWLVTFSKDVQNVDATDFSVNGGTTATVTGVVQNTASTYEVTVDGGDLADFNGTVGLDLDSGHNITDLSGNALPTGEPGTDETYVLDNGNPSVEIQGAPAQLTNSDPFTVTFKFSESVTGFILGDITVGNGTASNFSGSGDTYTALITPNGSGDVTIDVAANVAQDSTSNGNTAAVQQRVVYDNIPPSVEIQDAPDSVNNQNPFKVTFQFSENVTGFAVGDITVGNGSASSFSGSGGTYTANITPDGAGDITIDVSANVAEDQANNGNTAATQVTVGCGLGCNREETVKATKRAIQNFVSRRMVNITSDEPDFSSFLDGDGMGGGLMGFSPLNLKFNNNETQSSGSFSTSLQQFLKLQGKLEGSNNFARGRSGGTDDDLPGVEHSAPYSPANIWVKGRWSRSKEDRGNIDEKSDYSIVYVGADYRYKPDLLVGFMGQLDWSDEKSEGLGFEAEGRGWMLGPYIVTRLSDNLILDLRSTWGKSDNKINPIGTYWDEFETERWQLKGNLTGSFDYGDWNIRPSVGLSYFEETQEEYTDSNGFVIDEQTFSLGTLDFGPTFTYTYRNDDGLLIKPLIGIKGIWDFDAPDILDVNGIAVGTEELRAKLKLGLSMRLPSGTSMHGSYSYDGIGVSDYESHTGQLAISVPIGASWLPKGSMFQGSCAIQGVNSFSNLNQADSDEDYKVNFSLKIPWD